MAQGIAAKAGTSVRIFPTHAWASATLACMGVVFGDIGTSPLYTSKQPSRKACRATNEKDERAVAVGRRL